MNLADEQLKAALATLPERERKALELKAAGKSYQDIADALKVSRGTANRIAARATQKLNARLKAAARAAKWRNVLAGGTALDTSRADVAEAGGIGKGGNVTE